MIKIYDTLRQKKIDFKPIDDNKVKMYVCGVTTYDYCHLGHARTYVAFDIIYKYLKHRGYNVTYIRNITDIDDKIINRANEQNISSKELAEKYIKIMHEDFAKLKLENPDEEPKASETVNEIIDFIQDLIVKGFAYVGSNQDVFYDISKLKDYGSLSHQKLDSLMAGARVEQNDAKKSPLDFVLWKMAKEGEPYWESPWGNGRPGWHIECSAMANSKLGKTLDIHGGGFDLKFPHHENERAQSCARNDAEFVNYWMHAGFLNINEEKMSKSLKNFLTIRDALKEYDPEVIRYFFAVSHYRSEINFSDDNLDKAKNSLDRLYTAIRDINVIDFDESKIKDNKELSDYLNQFKAAMDDDFNTPEAFAVLFAIAKDINKYREQDKDLAGLYAGVLKEMAKLFGILDYNPNEYFQKSYTDISTEYIEAKIQERQKARENKDWALSDKIRDDLLAEGIILEDSKGKTTWKHN